MPGERERKDRLIQTRVPRDLEATLKDEARRRRVTLSHLIRSVLEDAFDLVDGVVADVDQLVADSVTLARNARDNARRLAAPAHGRPADRTGQGDHAEGAPDLADVYAWNEVVVERAACCSGCGSTIAPGDRGFVGLTDSGRGPRAWRCARCAAGTGEE